MYDTTIKNLNLLYRNVGVTHWGYDCVVLLHMLKMTEHGFSFAFVFVKYCGVTLTEYIHPFGYLFSYKQTQNRLNISPQYPETHSSSCNGFNNP